MSIKIDKFDLFITVVWVCTVWLLCSGLNTNVEQQSEIGKLNREIHKLHEEFCPPINYNSDSCKEYKEEVERLKQIENETEEEFRARVFK